jgi:CRISPR/Cas system CSM-associated protein Csm4 (group 5 of RAMP superfamily)
MSPLLLENNNKLINPSLLKLQETLILPLEVTNTLIEVQTLRAKKDLYVQICTLASKSHNQLLTRRLLFRKVIKGINKRDYELRKANMKIKELKERLKQLRLKKRQKVRTSPNSKFAITRAIKEAQIAAKER